VPPCQNPVRLWAVFPRGRDRHISVGASAPAGEPPRPRAACSLKRCPHRARVMPLRMPGGALTNETKSPQRAESDGWAGEGRRKNGPRAPRYVNRYQSEERNQGGDPRCGALPAPFAEPGYRPPAASRSSRPAPADAGRWGPFQRKGWRRLGRPSGSNLTLGTRSPTHASPIRVSGSGKPAGFDQKSGGPFVSGPPR
jgi:hypothetical protein